MRGMILALQFLTRLPLPVGGPMPEDALTRATPWFPAVGLVVGLFVAALVTAGARVDPWLGALLGLLGWAWITGGLHLDGLADLADALGAAHRDRERFIAVLRDPHVGGFAVIAVALQVLSKLVLLMLAARGGAAWLLVLIPAWARLGAVGWVQWLPSLTGGLAQACAGRSHRAALAAWGLLLAAASVAAVPVLTIAPAVLVAWWWFLQRRVGGMNGDCLGAGIELSESALLLALALAG